MQDETLAALERLMRDTEARGVLGFAKDKALIRAHIETLRAGGERMTVAPKILTCHTAHPNKGQ